MKRTNVSRCTTVLLSLFLCGSPSVGRANQSRMRRDSIARVANMPGELEVAVSADGNQVVVGVNVPKGLAVPPGVTYSSKTLFFSTDGGGTFAASEIKPSATGVDFLTNRRDPTVAWGGSGAFYFGTMGGTTAALGRSDDGGRTFVNLSLPGACHKDSAAIISCTTDQPHIAADRRPHAAGHDEVYIVWREKDSDGTTDPETQVVQCSQDSGLTWSARAVVGRGQFGRITVGPDGQVFVVMVNRRSGGNILLQRFGSCASGFQPAWSTGNVAAPRIVGAFTGVPCPVPGLDRCNDGNILASPTVAVDASNAAVVYVTYAGQVGPNAEAITTYVSSDGGASFPIKERLDGGIPARRFMPWSCGGRGELFVGWYDRRSATAAVNDNTSFYVNSLRYRHQAWTGTADSWVTSQEVDLSGKPDPQCAAGWPYSTRNVGDSESCSIQPQAAGLCFTDVVPARPCSKGDDCAANGSCLSGLCRTQGCSVAACDFSDGVLAGQFCGGGTGSKYGDYTGMACTTGGAFIAWTSATPPQGILDAPSSFNIYFARVSTVTLPHLAACENAPTRCDRPTRFGDALELACATRDCRLAELLPDICTMALDCPGCPPDGLCTYEYRLRLNGLGQNWSVAIVNERGRNIPSTSKRDQESLVVTVKQRVPTKDAAAPHYMVFSPRSLSPAPARVKVEVLRSR